MKKVNLFLVVAAFFAVSSVFVSCSDKEDSDPPTIDVSLKKTGESTAEDFSNADASISVPAGDGVKVTVKITWKADAGLSKVELDPLSDAPGDAVSLDKDFKPSNNQHDYTFEVPCPAGNYEGTGKYAEYQYNAKIADKNKGDEGTQTNSVTIKITFTKVEATTHNLGTAQTFKLGRPSASSEGLPEENATVGIKWISNLDGSTARFGPTSGAGIVVLSTKAAFDAITTQEGLKEAYDAGTTVNQMDCGPAGSSFVQKYFMTKVGSNYFLVNMTALTFNNSNNQATFSYQQ